MHREPDVGFDPVSHKFQGEESQFVIFWVVVESLKWAEFE